MPCFDTGFPRSIPDRRSIAPRSGSTSYTIPGTYTFKVPPGVYRLMIIFVGAGGSASSSYNSGYGPSGAGGGGGIVFADVMPGQTIPLTVGQGGAQTPVSNYNGSPGGDTSILGFTGKGGTGGVLGSGAGTGGSAIAPSSFLGSYYLASGGNGSSSGQGLSGNLTLASNQGTVSNGSYCSGGGGATPLSGHGGNDYENPGGIGSGGSGGNANEYGGAGGNGAVAIYW